MGSTATALFLAHALRLQDTNGSTPRPTRVQVLPSNNRGAAPTFRATENREQVERLQECHKLYASRQWPSRGPWEWSTLHSWPKEPKEAHWCVFCSSAAATESTLAINLARGGTTGMAHVLQLDREPFSKLGSSSCPWGYREGSLQQPNKGSNCGTVRASVAKGRTAGAAADTTSYRKWSRELPGSRRSCRRHW